MPTARRRRHIRLATRAALAVMLLLLAVAALAPAGRGDAADVARRDFVHTLG